MNGKRVLSAASLFAVAVAGWAKAEPECEGFNSYVFFARDRHRIQEESFLETRSLEGAQLKYTWRELEPEKDRYELEPIRRDLTFLDEHGKRLFVQLQDVSFSPEIINVPDYLRQDPLYSGGVAATYRLDGDDESKAVVEGWVARRWDAAVAQRFHRLLAVLGRELDGRIEGINLPETAIELGNSGAHHPEGFTFEGYVEAVKSQMRAAREAFPRSTVIQYANFMPGEWLPRDDRGFLRSIYRHAAAIGVGVGNPDLLPHRRGQLEHSYPLIAGRPETVVAGVAVQDGNLEARDPDTGGRVSVDELARFARELRLDFVFWGAEEPYYSEEVLPFLRASQPPAGQ